MTTAVRFLTVLMTTVSLIGSPVLANPEGETGGTSASADVPANLQTSPHTFTSPPSPEVVPPSERAVLPGDEAKVRPPETPEGSPESSGSTASGKRSPTGQPDTSGGNRSGEGDNDRATLPSGRPMTSGIVATTPDAVLPPVVLPEPRITRLKQFAIPFQTTFTGQPMTSPSVVQLIGSSDRGQTWYIIGSATPAQKQFLFRSSGDQEYWFRIRSLNAYMMPLEQEGTQPQMRVIVDSVSPELALIAQAWRRSGDESPQTLVRWRVQDPHFDPKGFRLLVWNVTDSSWKEVTFPESCWDGASPIWDGEVVCPYPPDATTTFRAEATDLAGNFISRQTGVTPSTGSTTDGSPGVTDLDPSLLYPSEQAAAEAERRRRLPGTSTVNSGGWRGTLQTGPGAESRISGEELLASEKSDDGLVSMELLPPYGSKAPSAPGRFRGLPDGVWPQMSNARDFEIGYDVSDVGPSGVARVELWGTRDGGKVWKKFGDDPDRMSPVSVMLEQEGWYGFIVTVRSGAGVGTRPPESGDMAQVWIGVDRTPPYGRFLDLKYEDGKLIARYEIEEVWLAGKPIRFFYATSATGPWTPIGTDNLDATGLFVWTLDPSIPSRFYLRMEMRDRAGNTGSCDWSEEIIADRERPAARIRQVRPLNQVHVPDTPDP
ncbi:MAG: hypothetical protein Q4C47_00165 [Planctomycetia bacterium]|nr:hypothetical protein [Planctomycetia bacterium]